MPQLVPIQVRRGSAAAWTTANPTLLGGELGFENDTNKVKIGDGSTIWASLAYLVPSLTAYALLASPTFTGTPAAPTASAGTATTQLATTAFVDTSFLKLSGGTLTGALTLSADPVSALQPATKQYADALVNGLDWKASVRAATTANITLSGAQTIDGVSVVAGDRVLVKSQTTASGNGIYVCAAGAWSRATDADASAEVTSALTTSTEEGTANGGVTYKLTTSGTITLDTTSLVFAAINAGGTTAASSVTFTPTGGLSSTDVQAALGELDTEKANLASPTFTGTAAAPTAAVSTNTTQVATTAFVVGQVATVAPLATGTAAVGTSLLYARQDHVHALGTVDGGTP